MDQIVKNEMAFVDILGFFPTYLRPPYESCNGDCLNDLGATGYHVLNYDMDTLDWQENYPHSQQIFLSALQGGKPATNSFIELSHDIHDGTVHGFAQFMIDNLRQMGYTTTLVGDCLNDPSINWYRNPVTGQAWNNATVSSSATGTSASARPAKVASSGTTTPANASPTAPSEGVAGFGGDAVNRTGTSNNLPTNRPGNTTTYISKSGAGALHVSLVVWWTSMILMSTLGRVTVLS